MLIMYFSVSLCISVSQTVLDQGPLKNLKTYITNCNLIRCQSGKKASPVIVSVAFLMGRRQTSVKRSLQTGEI